MNLKRKLVAVALTISILLMNIGCIGNALNATQTEVLVTGGFMKFDITTGAIVGYTGSPTNVEIPTQINGINVSNIENYAFLNCSSLTSITIPNSIVSIGEGAFRDCTGLANVIIPDSITSISTCSFYNCSSLSRISIPGSITIIGELAFWNCKSLSAAYFYGNAPSLGKCVFDDTKSGFTINYLADKAGYPNPWNGYQTKTFVNEITQPKATLIPKIPVTTTINTIDRSTQATTIRIGDYVQFGKYYDEPILWRCVDIDENGPLMLTDKLITAKPFDGRGTHKYLDGSEQADPNNFRKENGSNLWETSDMRSWLNSDTTAGNVKWLDGCPPNSPFNAYYNEKGFLADGNFTQDERDAIKTVAQKSLLNGVDVKKLYKGGTEDFKWSSDIETVVQNYDTAIFDNVEDKVFLLDVKQLNKVYQNGNILGRNYYMAKLTQKAVDNCIFHGDKHSDVTVDTKWYYALRTPIGILPEVIPETSNAQYVFASRSQYNDLRCVIESISSITSIYPVYNDVGVRPAFYINLSSIIIRAGNGTEKSPFKVGPFINVAINNDSVPFTTNLGFPFVDSNGRTQVPLRVTMERFGAIVDYDAEKKMAYVQKNGINIKIPINENYIIVNGSVVHNDTTAVIVDGRTYCPIRKVFEAFGVTVRWVSESKSVFVEYMEH